MTAHTLWGRATHEHADSQDVPVRPHAAVRGSASSIYSAIRTGNKRTSLPVRHLDVLVVVV